MLVQGLLNPKHKSRGHRPLIPNTQKPIAIVEDCHCVGCFQGQESSFPKTTFPSSTKVKALPMNAESRPLSYLQMNQLRLRNNWVKFQATGKLGMVFKGIYNGMYLK